MINKFFLKNFYCPIKLINSITSSKNNCVTVINYHGIPDLDIENFKLQIKWLKNNYSIIKPDEFQDFLNGKININQHSVLVTFDDGFISSYNVIQDFLNSLGIKVFFFIPSMFIIDVNNKWEEIISNNFFSGRLDSNNFPKAYKPISIEKIKILIDQGHIIGAHTNSHCDISKIISDKQLKKEIIDPIHLFKNKFNINLNSFAFPYGRINHINDYLLKKISLNYEFCFSNIRGTNNNITSNFGIKRQNVSPDMPIKYFGFILEGGLDLYWIRHAKKLDFLSRNIT